MSAVTTNDSTGPSLPTQPGTGADALRGSPSVVIPGLSPTLSTKVAELLELEEGWDGAGARPPTPQSLAMAVKLILRLKEFIAGFAEPFLAPTIAGSIQLEWQFEPRTLEFETARDRWLVTGSEKDPSNGRVYHTAECSTDEIGRLARFQRWLQGVEPSWPSA